MKLCRYIPQWAINNFKTEISAKTLISSGGPGQWPHHLITQTVIASTSH